MPSLTKKKIKGRNYYYIVETQRVNGKPRIINQIYLGTVEGILQRLCGEKPFKGIQKMPASKPPAPAPRGIPQKNNQGRDMRRMTTDKRKIGEKIDLGTGQVALGGIFEGIETLMERISKLREQAEISHKGVFGFTIKTNLDGQPIVERFGNIREEETGPVVQAVREPIVDVIEEPDNVTVVAELPGVDDREIKLSAQGDVLIIESDGEQNFGKEILLPFAVDGARLKRSYKNGILKVTLPKAK